VGTVALVVGILLLVACLLLGYLAYRRVRLMHGGGVDVCLRRHHASRAHDSTAGWHFGVGRYQGDDFAWFRLTSFRPGATVVIDRTDVEIVDRRHPTDSETYAIPAAGVVLSCRVRGEHLELAMPPGVLTGFLAWLEASPPGRTGYRQAS
jgi:hypothetical protein